MIDPLTACRAANSTQSFTLISFYLQHRSDVADVYAVDSEGEIVRTVATDRRMRKGVRTPDGVFRWNGRLWDRRVAARRLYHFRVALLHQDRGIDLTDVPVRVRRFRLTR